MLGNALKLMVEKQKQEIGVNLSKQLNTIILGLSQKYGGEVLLRLSDGETVEVMSMKQNEPLEVIRLSDLVPLTIQVLSMLKVAGKSKAEVFEMARVKFIEMLDKEGGACVYFRYNKVVGAPDALLYDGNLQLKQSNNLLSLF